MVLVSAGPVWFRKKSKQVLLACRRQELSRRRKHAGNIANGLRCSPWGRAESPAKILTIMEPEVLVQEWIMFFSFRRSHSTLDAAWNLSCLLITCGTVVCCCCSSLSSCMMMATYVRSCVLRWTSCTTTLMAGNGQRCCSCRGSNREKVNCH